jgi:glycosyltransferase involved in cell wall biosynthesis
MALPRPAIGHALEEFKPDIIQIWGSENPLKMLPFINIYPAAKVLTMQGVMASIADKSLIGISFGDLIKTFGIRELIKRENIYSTAKSFDVEAKLENEMILKSDFIITQSNWTDSQIKHLNKKAKFFRVQRELRPDFVTVDKKWTEVPHSQPIIYSAAVGYTLKGLHILIKALAIIKSYYPNIELRLAGAIGRTDLFGDGYLRLILKYIKANDLENNVVWLGAISSKDIITNLQEASVFVNPSFVESYSMVVAESMAIGTPAVISYAGAMPELAEDKKEALFFTPGDFKQLASCIISLLSDAELSKKISLAAQERANLRLNHIDNVIEQYQIYEEIIKVSNSNKL